MVCSNEASPVPNQNDCTKSAKLVAIRKPLFQTGKNPFSGEMQTYLGVIIWTLDMALVQNLIDCLKLDPFSEDEGKY